MKIINNAGLVAMAVWLIIKGLADSLSSPSQAWN